MCIRDSSLPNIVFPEKRFYTTTDPVMTPELLDYFFNQRTQLFANLRPSEKRALHAIYDLPAYKACLPALPVLEENELHDRRQHRRFSISCPGEVILATQQTDALIPLKVVECSTFWLRAEIRNAPVSYTHLDVYKRQRQ